ncbi:hypothetical protein [Tessaracoccus sp.]|uniref:hypothetical protein n=1 Tax=Tessaracoccus sp. TaxID=1971211 RepID=UPI0026219ABC|nr:hypothetical protein [Tessaracoccus sp.]
MNTGLRPILSARIEQGLRDERADVGRDHEPQRERLAQPDLLAVGQREFPNTVETAAMNAQQMTRRTSRQWLVINATNGSLAISPSFFASSNAGVSCRLRRM